MRIHSKHRDYYDIGLTQGIDPSLHYLRKERAFTLRELKSQVPEHVLRAVNHGIRTFREKEIQKFSIGFCGAIYNGIIVSGSSTFSAGRAEYVYSPGRLLELFPYAGDNASKRWKRNISIWSKYGMDRTVESLIDWLKPCFGYDSLFRELSTSYKGEYVPAPVFTLGTTQSYRHSGGWENVEIKINTPIGILGFAKVKDPFTAFQEISMYLGNQLVYVEQPLQISDKDMLVEKGFDPKTSFRHPVRLSQL